MLAALQSLFSSRISCSQIDFSTIKNKTIESCQTAFAFLQETARANIPGLMALGFDVIAGNKLLSTSSATFACTAATVAAYALPSLLRKGAAKVLARIPIGLFIAGRIGNADLVRECIQAGGNVHQRAPNGILPLQAACSFGYEEVAEVLLEAGAQIDQIDGMGQAPLHVACSGGRERVVDLLLRSGAKVDAVCKNGFTPLKNAVLFNHPNIVKVLMAAGANPYIEPGFSSALKIAQENLQMVKMLTGTEKIAAFASCKDIHDFFAVLFPPSLEELPANWEDLVANLEKDGAITQFIEEAQKMGISPSLGKYALELNTEATEHYLKAAEAWFANPNRFQVKLPEIKQYSVHELLEIMLQRSPLFKKAWEIANQEEKIRLEEHSDEAFSEKGKSVHQKGQHADYDPATHTIRINKNKKCFEKISSLVFETINALQRKSFQKKSPLSEQGRVSREGHTLITERIELNSSRWRERILEGNPDLDFQTFLTFWKESNVPYANGLISHADSYRRRWDNVFGMDYLIQNQGWFFRRLQELQGLSHPGDYKAPIEDAKDRKD